jgi:dienelactone hydrolase
MQLTPASVLADELPALDHDSAGDEVTALQADAAGREWSALARATDPVDLGRLLASMTTSEPGIAYTPPDKRIRTVVGIGRELATVERRLIGEGVTEEAPPPPIVGRLFVPASGAGNPVLLLHGSDGQIRTAEAALLASRGLLVLAIAFFNAPGLPQRLLEVPLEYIAKACRFLASHRATARPRVAISGVSRGAEAALLVASAFPELVDRVVAISPSSQAWSASGLPEAAAWTLEGEALPTIAAIPPPTPEGTPIVLRPRYEQALTDTETVEASAIRTERSDARLLLLSGAADAMWPSADHGERIVARMRAHGLGDRVEHVVYPEAGHAFGIPHLPVLAYSRHPILNLDFAYGGSLDGVARARVAAWRRRLDFLSVEV